MSGFSEDQIRRYSRHMLLKELGGKGQRRLMDASVLVVGAGGLGCPALIALAAAGVGKIAIADPDVVDLSNLQRQTLYGTSDVGKPKAELAAAALRRLNPEVSVEPHAVAVTADNAAALIRGRTLVLEGSDSAETKFAVNDACVAASVPLIVGGVVRWHGQIATVLPGAGCYRCLWESPPSDGDTATCEAEGVLGPAAATVGSWMGVEACRMLTGTGKPPAGRMMVFDFLEGGMREILWKRRPGCTACGS